MEKSTIIIIAVIAVILIGLPLASQIKKSAESAAPTEAAPEAAEAESASAPEAAPAPVVQAPGLDANTLAGTVWQVPVDKISLTVTFQPGGTLLAQNPMLRAMTGSDTVTGTWSVSGANLAITVSAAGKTKSTNATISGTDILVKGQPAQRIQ